MYVHGKMLHRTMFHCVLGSEEIEFVQLMFKDNLINDGYLGGNLHGKMATEELHFGEGMHRKAFRSKVMQGLVPVFSPGHPCVLKVHNTVIAYGAKSKDEIVQRNYKLAMQVNSFSSVKKDLWEELTWVTVFSNTPLAYLFVI